MYQIEMKAALVRNHFRKSDGWRVTVDVDPMERAKGGQHPHGKRERVQVAEAELRDQLSATIGIHPKFGRVDVVAEHPDRGTVLVEVEGESSRQLEQAMYSAIGQLVTQMNQFDGSTTYAIAVPDSPKWKGQLAKIPAAVAERLQLHSYLVSDGRVRDLTAP